jgi:hypothetical protein
MKRLIAYGLVFAMASAGCGRTIRDGIEMPTGDAARVVNVWGGLTRLPPGTEVVVTLDAGAIVDGPIVAATEFGLDIARPGGRMTLTRESVVRVVQITSKSGIYAKQGAVIGLLLGGLVAVLTKGKLWQGLVVEPPLYAGIGAAAGSFEQRQVLVYQRLSSPPK